MHVKYYNTSIGQIGIVEQDGCITHVLFSNDLSPDGLKDHETPVLKEAVRQLESYLAGKLREFSLPLAPAGTPFMKQVWDNLCKIPYGKTATYKEIAEKLASPKAARAVGLANNRNPIPIFIPCHRVIGADGSLTGYRGGLDIKKRLLELERT